MSRPDENANINVCHRYFSAYARKRGQAFDGDGAARLVAEQSVDDLWSVGTMVPAVAALRKFAALAFEIA